MNRSTIILGAGFALFLAFIAYLLAASLARREAPVFSPTVVAPRPVTDSLVEDTITIDARDTHRWAFFDFARRSVVWPPDTSGWDLAFRRFHVMAADGITDLGPGSFEAVTDLPESGYVANTMRNDTLNPAMRRWYRYGMLTHLLEPNGHMYAVRTRDGRYAKLEILSYYCEGLSAGCFTFRYAYRHDGVARF